jgi:hypothetical protein
MKSDDDTEEEGGAQDFLGGLSQKVRLIKSREVAQELELPHRASSNAGTHAGVDKEKRANCHFHPPRRTTVNQIKLLTIGLSPGGEGRMETSANS